LSAPLGEDVLASLNEAVMHKTAMDRDLNKLRDAVTRRDWAAVEEIRFGLHTAMDGYVDAYATAGRRLMHAL